MAEYYNMQEVMDKLRKTEEEVQDLVKQGQLRQYLDDGNPVFKTDDVEKLSEEIVGLDITSLGDSMGEVLDLDLDLDLDQTSESKAPKAEPQPEPLDASEIGLEETSDIELLPDDSDEDKSAKKAGPDDMDLDIEPDIKNPESEGGFGLSQMGDLTMADTNVGTIGINILSGTGDAYQLTDDTRAETRADDFDEIESLDADANLESLGSGSGLLDLSLQADDTSLGAVLDDILPTGAEGGGPIVGGIDEAADLLAEPEPAMDAVGAPMGEPMGAQPIAAPVGAVQMVSVAQVDPKTNIFGVMMFLPVLGLILLAIVLTAGAQNVLPSILNTILKTQPGGVNLIWYVVGGASLLSILIVAFSAVAGGSGGGGGKTSSKTKKTKEKKPKKEKKAKKRK